jgi:hypothetical protein
VAPAFDFRAVPSLDLEAMLTALLSLAVAQATIYTWVDREGVEHFTDDASQVPKGVKARTTTGEEVSRLGSDVTERSSRPRKAVAVDETSPEPPSRAEQEWRRLFREAHARIASLEEEIEEDRNKVEVVNGLPVSPRFSCLGPWWGPGVPMGTIGGGWSVVGQLPGGAVVTAHSGTAIAHSGQVFMNPCLFTLNPEFERIRERLAKNRRELERARADLADLERRAAFEAVPLHWRR